MQIRYFHLPLEFWYVYQTSRLLKTCYYFVEVGVGGCQSDYVKVVYRLLRIRLTTLP